MTQPHDRIYTSSRDMTVARLTIRVPCCLDIRGLRSFRNATTPRSQAYAPRT
jgi:hypothetical protein